MNALPEAVCELIARQFIADHLTLFTEWLCAQGIPADKTRERALYAVEQDKSLPEDFTLCSVLQVAGNFPTNTIGPSKTHSTLAMARFCHEHPRDLSAWLAERGLDEQLIHPWVSRWLQGQAILEKLRHANNAGTRGGTQ